MERFFQRGKIGVFIVAIAITLFSNFYFSYYQAIVLGIYFLLRIILNIAMISLHVGKSFIYLCLVRY